MVKRFLFYTLLLFICSSAILVKIADKAPPFITDKAAQWADSVIKKLSPEERIAQLFMVAAYSDDKKQKPKEIVKLITENKIGGLIFFQGGPVRQAKLTNYYQSLSKVPLLISIDGEWGLAMRLDSTIAFPRQMTLGAIQNDTLVYQMGYEIARQCKRMGIHVNFAPVADINNNPLNPVIGNRSFGEDKYNVSRKAIMYMRGMQDNGVLANAKHFPGHGDTDSDSHKTLPTINSSQIRMDSLELYPFKEMISQGLGSMMVAHLFIPAYDSTKNTASTLSKYVVTDLLKNKLQFNGLIFTDALNMKGVSKFYKPGELNVKALLAGNDVLLFADDVPDAITKIKTAIDSNQITQNEIDARCKKILMTKYWCGLNNAKKISTKNLISDLNNPRAKLMNRRLVESAITLLNNKNDLIPLMRLDTLRIAAVSLGYDADNAFKKRLNSYTNVDCFGLDKDCKQPQCDSLFAKLDKYNLIIIQINNTNNQPAKNFGYTDKMQKVINQIIRKKKTIVDVFGTPYILSKMDSIQFADAVIMSYEVYDDNQDLSAQLIFGGITAKGKLPVTASPFFKLGDGVSTRAPIRFKYTVPEELDINSLDLRKIDTIAMKGIFDKAYPGCQILVAKDGKVFYQKSFGYHTYENKVKVQNSDLYDLASITKIAGSTAAMMKMVEEEKIKLDDSLSVYLPYLLGTNKSKINFREMMTHQAGLKDWIPFWMRTVTKGEYVSGIYDTAYSQKYSLQVANKLFINNAYVDSIYKWIVKSEIKDAGKYKYSDLGYYFIKQIIEQKTNLTLDNYLNQTFYAPLGLSTMTYNPLKKIESKRIVPTEYDVKFRKQLIKGYVHDQGAAMMGGVAGHAGLFSNANDLAVMMQLFMQNGEYGGVRYIDSNVVKEFIKCQFCQDNRRALGFDKPETHPDKGSPVCECVSYFSFGHTGFTGTIAWADPEKNLVYIFLSNRVYPDADINKLAKMGIRSKIQEVIYASIK